jgi:hypothetical protein
LYINSQSDKMSYENTNSASFLPSASCGPSGADAPSSNNINHAASELAHKLPPSENGSYIYSSLGGQNDDSAARLIHPSEGQHGKREQNILIRD